MGKKVFQIAIGQEIPSAEETAAWGGFNFFHDTADGRPAKNWEELKKTVDGREEIRRWMGAFDTAHVLRMVSAHADLMKRSDLSFGEALSMMESDQRAARLPWNAQERRFFKPSRWIYLRKPKAGATDGLSERFFVHRSPLGLTSAWSITTEDALAKDWYIIPEDPSESSDFIFPPR
jgi:hypothetical protein